MVETLPKPAVKTLPAGETSAPLPEAEGPEPQKRLLTREEYYKMAEAGIFGPDERLELLDGEVYKQVTPQKSSHFYVVETVQEALRRAFGEGFVVRAQGPLLFDAHSEPEPDVSVVPGSRRDFVANHPRLSDAALVVEVADTSLRTDRQVKAPFYARAGVQDYWIVNLRNRTVEAYRQPAEGAGTHGYKHRRIYTEDESLSPIGAPEAVIAVSDILPPE